jgi:hypothetical protein
VKTDLEETIAALEEVTSRLMAHSAEEQEKFGALLSRRAELAERLAVMAPVAGAAAERIRRVIEHGEALEARVLALAAGLRAELANAGREERFAREVGSAVAGVATATLDVRA